MKLSELFNYDDICASHNTFNKLHISRQVKHIFVASENIPCLLSGKGKHVR